MAGPGTRGQSFRRQMQKKQQSVQENLGGSRQLQVSSRSTSSNGITAFLTPTSSPQGQPDALNIVHPQTSESRASGENETILSSDDGQNGSTDVSMQKRRGRTRNITLARKREANETLTFEVDPYIRRIVGKDAQYFISESGCLVRKFGKLNVEKWAHMQSEDRDSIYNMVTDDFRFEENTNSKTAVNRQLNILYRNHRYRLHRYFLTFDTKEEAIRQVPEGVSSDDWKWLCNYFGSEEFKKISDRNKINRAKNETHTTVGTKSLARLVEEKKRKEGVELSEIDVFELSRTSKKTRAMVNDAAKNTLASMKELASTSSMTSKQICEQQLGYIPGQLRGRSATKKQAAELDCWRSEIEEQRRRADEAEQRAAAMVEEFNAQKELIKNLQEQQSETRALYEQLIAQMKEFRK